MRGIKKFQLGKNGLNGNFIEMLKNYFEKSKSEIGKVEMLKSACRDKKQAEEIGNELVDKLGKNYTYKLIGYVLTIQKWRKARR